MVSPAGACSRIPMNPQQPHFAPNPGWLWDRRHQAGVSITDNPGLLAHILASLISSSTLDRSLDLSLSQFTHL